MDFKTLFDLFGHKTKVLDKDGNEQELLLSKGFVHKVSMMVICYLFGIMSAVISILTYLEVDISRPALIEEVQKIEKVSIRNRLLLDIELQEHKIHVSALELSMRYNEKEDTALSIEYANDSVQNVDEKRKLIAAYRREGKLINILIKELDAEIDSRKARIATLKEELKGIPKDK